MVKNTFVPFEWRTEGMIVKKTLPPACLGDLMRGIKFDGVC